MKKKIEDIVAAYNSEIRGFYNYYRIANNVAYALSKFGYIDRKSTRLNSSHT